MLWSGAAGQGGGRAGLDMHVYVYRSACEGHTPTLPATQLRACWGGWTLAGLLALEAEESPSDFVLSVLHCLSREFLEETESSCSL